MLSYLYTLMEVKHDPESAYNLIEDGAVVLGYAFIGIVSIACLGLILI